MAISVYKALAIAMANVHHIYKLDNVCALTRVDEHRKIPAFGLVILLWLRPQELP